MFLQQNIFVKFAGFTFDDKELVEIDSQNFLTAVEFLKNNSDVKFEMLYSIVGVDYENSLGCIYHFYSMSENINFLLRVLLNRENPHLPSITSIYSSANWHERETYDLFGIKFLNHPDLRRILLPESWKGHPLRRDYVQDDERLVWNQR